LPLLLPRPHSHPKLTPGSPTYEGQLGVWRHANKSSRGVAGQGLPIRHPHQGARHVGSVPIAVLGVTVRAVQPAGCGGSRAGQRRRRAESGVRNWMPAECRPACAEAVGMLGTHTRCNSPHQQPCPPAPSAHLILRCSVESNVRTPSSMRTPAPQSTLGSTKKQCRRSAGRQAGTGITQRQVFRRSAAQGTKEQQQGFFKHSGQADSCVLSQATHPRHCRRSRPSGCCR
jgi:hypothetical protein